LRAVLVATDSPRIVEAVQAAGGRAVMTPAELPSGLDRVAEAAQSVDDDIIVNIQGDEPFVSPAGLDHLVSLFQNPDVVMATLAAPFPAGEDLADPNRVKVVVDRKGRALYFSRSPIPYGATAPLLHVGVYAYRRDTLFELARQGPCPLELAERLEQLRALWNGIPIQVAVGGYGSLGIDTPGDLERARQLFGEGREMA
jgi:3-deoxy-manno-octulosonate cytidylyltransferase (CMP-KDO synthetase)